MEAITFNESATVEGLKSCLLQISRRSLLGL